MPNNMDPDALIHASKDHVTKVLNDFDFAGATERFDESLTAIQLLFELDIEDTLHMSTNVGIRCDIKFRDKTISRLSR